MQKQKVLYLTSRLPYPAIGGDKLRSYNLLKILAKKYEVTLVVITDEVMDEDTKKTLEKDTKVLKVFTKPKYLFYLNTLKFLFNSLPLQVNYYYFNDVQKYITNVLKEVDFSVSNLIRTTEYLQNSSKNKYLDMVDSIGLNYQASQKNVKSLFWKAIYTVETDRLLKYEKECVKEFNNTILVNKYETEYWSKFGTVTWIPNGVNEELFNYEKINPKYSNMVAFFGKMDYQPNVDAVMWFIDNVLKDIDKNLKFIIIGTKPNQNILELSKKYDNIEITGFVDDPFEILNSVLTVVAPMQTGGGIQNKILESMALGTINIVSSLGAKPIVGAEDKEHLFVCDNGSDVSKLINDIYKDKDKYEYVKNNSRNLIKKCYTWKECENTLFKITGDIK